MKKNNLKSKEYSIIPFIVAVSLFALLMFLLFFMQSLNSNNINEPFYSDLVDHIRLTFRKKDPSPALLHVVIAAINKLTSLSPHLLFPAFMVLCNVVSIILLRQYFTKKYNNESQINQYIIDFFAVSLLLVFAITIPSIPIDRFEHNWYLFKFPGNIYHNSTYLSCRVLAIPVFILVFKSYRTFEINKKASVKYYLLLAFFSVLCMFAKPSFFIGFMPACCIVMAIELFITKFKSFWPSFWCGIAFIPALIVVLWQNAFYFGGNDGSGITFMPFFITKAYNVSVPHLIFNIICGSAFPLFMMFLCVKHKLFSLTTKIGFINWFTSIGASVLLVETGIRLIHGNMTWTGLTGTFFAFVVGAELLLKNNFNKSEKTVAWALYLIHTFYGIAYFIWLLKGGLYI